MMGKQTADRERDSARESAERFRRAFDDSPIGMALVATDGRWLQVNRALREITGYSETELLACTFQQITHPDDLETDLDNVRLILDGEVRTYQMEKRYIHKRGHFVRVLLHVSLVRDEAGAPLYFISQVQDITERHAALEALRESEERFQIVTRATNDAVWDWDLLTGATWHNESVRIFGYAVEDVQPHISWWRERIRPDEKERVEAGIRAVIEGGGRAWSDEYHFRRADGSYASVLDHGYVLREGGGRPARMIGAMSDITKRKEAEDALRASEAELRALFAAMNDVIFVLDREGRYLRVAPTSPSLLYLPPAELVGKTVREALPPEQAELIAGGVRRALDLRRPVNVEYGLEIAGEKMWFLGTASPLTEESVIFVARDITERRRAAEALQKSEEQLLQAQKMESIGTLAGGVAHDFNNLLTAILGNTQLALRAVGPGHPLRRRLLEIEKAGSRAGALTRQLLAFSRRQRLERRNINLNDTVADITRMLQRIIGADVEVSVTPAPDLLPVFADPAQIEQVVMNLAVNARDAMPHGGRLLIETRNVVLDEDFRRQYPYVEPGSYVELRVSDTGTGMDEGTRARAFEPFFTTKGVGQGTGLGLAMTYGIVKQHGGYIHVRSEVGRGAAFHIFLPASKEEAGAESRPAALPLVGGTETVLVAEDEEALRRLARDILEGLGYKVLLASDGEDALEVYEANRERIDLLLMDVVMPRLGGAEAAERIRAAGGRAPVIFVTGYSAETVQSRFVEENKAINDMAAAVIQKPYGVESLGRAVRHALDSAANK